MFVSWIHVISVASRLAFMGSSYSNRGFGQAPSAELANDQKKKGIYVKMPRGASKEIGFPSFLGLRPESATPFPLAHILRLRRLSHTRFADFD